MILSGCLPHFGSCALAWSYMALRLFHFLIPALMLRPDCRRDDYVSCLRALTSFRFLHGRQEWLRPALAAGRQDRGSTTGWDPRPPEAADKCGPRLKDRSKGKRKDSFLASPSCLYSFPQREWDRGYNAMRKQGR